MRRFKLLLPAHFIVHAYSTIHEEERLPEITLRVEISLHPWLTTRCLISSLVWDVILRCRCLKKWMNNY